MDDVAPSGGALISHQHHRDEAQVLLALESNDVPRSSSGSSRLAALWSCRLHHESWLMEGAATVGPLRATGQPRRVDHALEWMRTHDAECKSVARYRTGWRRTFSCTDACMKETTLDCITSPHLAEAILKTPWLPIWSLKKCCYKWLGPKQTRASGSVPPRGLRRATSHAYTLYRGRGTVRLFKPLERN